MFTDRMHKVENNKGVTGHGSYAVYVAEGQDQRLYAFDVIGSEAAVKALFAGFYQSRQGRLTFMGLRGGKAPTTLFRDEAVQYKVEKEALKSGPTLHRWHFRAIPKASDPYLAVYGFVGSDQTAEQALYNALQNYTVWPVRPAWAAALYAAGEEQDLLQPLRATANLAFAYRLHLSGWHTLIDTLAKVGELSLT